MSSISLANEVAAIARASKGRRNHTLNKAAYSLGQLVAGGQLDGVQVENALTAIALSTGLARAEVINTIKSGLSGGAKMPIKIAKKSEITQRDAHASRKTKKFASVQLNRPA